MISLRKLLNLWIEYPKYEPEKRGWYLCTCRFESGFGKYQSYVMDLFWDEDMGCWKDNRRLHIFEVYDVYGCDGKIDLSNLKDDHLCYRNDVIAFKRIPKVYKYSKKDL